MQRTFITENQKLYQFLLQAGTIDQKKLADAYAKSSEGAESLADYLVSHELMSDENVGKILADQYNLPFIQLSQVDIAENVLKTVPEVVARKQQILPFKQDSKGLHVAVKNPNNQQIIEFLQKKTGLRVRVYFTTSASFQKGLQRYQKSIHETFNELIDSNVKASVRDQAAEPPIIAIVNTIIDYAYLNNASDVHIEPLEETTLVRFRIDGQLHDMLRLPIELGPQLVTRVKVMASLRTDEHHEPQDGKIVYKTDQENLDLRLSIAPITNGEKIVMRLLSEKTRQFSLQDLGLQAAEEKKILEASKLSHGMILATGPTGSGKTTTLYAIVKLINTRDINIMTIEDPVEYEIDNVNQMQVNQQTQLTFAKGLRSIVRQDPDVILVGEVRDEETADIAINSAMTGHLVLSTLHTNDAATSFPRLIDMNVEPYLIASSVKVIIAQRLVRKICSSCRVSDTLEVTTLDKEILQYLKSGTELQTYRGKGCPVCHHSGYSGRVGIYEVLLVTPEISEAVIARQSASQIKNVAIKQGMRTMIEDGIEKVQQGITTLEEVLRVIKD